MQLSPIEVPYFTRKKIMPFILAAGDQHSAAITKDHELFTWGNGINLIILPLGDYFRLGHGICMDELEPKKVEVL
jgi:alpha-tubulin suppressor-like RCC1 family protein